jgi:hypothetical protein
MGPSICNICHESFETKALYRMHKREHIDLSSLDPPFDGIEGEWVLRKDFQVGKKSFGYFKCDTCSKDWVSAHSFTNYRQECKDCQSGKFPIALWINKGSRVEKDEFTGRPHLKELCEACTQGVCQKPRF